MADGSISMADGLGLKARDLNELWKKHQINSDLTNTPQNHHPLSENPKSPIPIELETPSLLVSNESVLGFITGHTKPQTLSSGFGVGAHSPNSSKYSSPSRKLQQVFQEERLKVEAEEQETHLYGRTYHFEHPQSEVPNSNPNPNILFNARANPYVEGDPNLGYSVEDIRSRYAKTHLKLGAVLTSVGSPHISPVAVPISKPQFPPAQRQQLTSKDQSYQHHSHLPNPKPSTGQSKPKPKNWASLLQSQSPSLDMKLDYFPDLQRGKEALVEIDLELTEVGKWNRYLVGHFLDGKMAYPVLFSPAHNQWKDLFVAVKQDVAGFYLFEFKNEQAKIQVLEGGPYFFSQKYLVLKDWHRMMKPAQDLPTIIPAWVKLHDLPFELWNQECLSRVASTIGKPLHVDKATA